MQANLVKTYVRRPRLQQAHTQLQHAPAKLQLTSKAPCWSSYSNLHSRRFLPGLQAAGVAADWRPSRRSSLVIRRALPDDSSHQPNSPSSSSSSSPPSGSQTPSRTSYPSPLNPATAQQLLNHLQTLTHQPPPSTPLSPLVALTAPLSLQTLNRWSPSLLLGVLRLYNITGYTPGSDWLAAWGSAVNKQLGHVSSEVACYMVAEVLRLKQGAAIPQGLLDALFVGALKDMGSCSSSSLAAVMTTVAAAELRSSSGSSSILSSNGNSAPPASPAGPEGKTAAVVAAAAADLTAASWQQHTTTPAEDETATAAAAVMSVSAASDADDGQQRPGSFACLINSSSSSRRHSNGSSSSSKPPAMGLLSSWADLAAAAADVKADAAAATAAQKHQYAVEAAAAGAAAAAAQQVSSSSSRGVDFQDLAAAIGVWQQPNSRRFSSKFSSSIQGSLHPSSSSSSSSSSAANIVTAGWLGGYSSSSSDQQQHLSDCAQLTPIVLHSWMIELSQPGRFQQLQPDEVAAVSAAAAALQLRTPAGWLDSLVSALQQRLVQYSPAALACLSCSLPLLMPRGGALRLWRQLGAIVQQQGVRLSSSQLCEVLPLVQAADLAVPTLWLQQAIARIQGGLSSLQLTQSSRALVASVSLGYNPPKPWLDTYMQRFRSGLSELNPEGLVDVLRALATAGALPSHEWLLEFERDVGRRFGFIGPVELSSTAFLFANLAHIPSDTWKRRFMSEALKFRVYYTGNEVTQVVWSAVRMGCKPNDQWLRGYVQQMHEQLKNLQAYQLAFTFAALQKLGATFKPSVIDDILDSYALLLDEAQPSDTALLLVTVARLKHVTSYKWLEDVLDNCQARMLQYDGPELVTLLWSLAQLHHQPGPEWLNIFCEACAGQLALLSGSQLAQLLYGFAQLNWEPPASWMQAYLQQTQVLLTAGEVTGRDAASYISSLSTLKHTPSEQWLHACLQLLYFKLPELDPEGCALIAISLAKLKVVVGNGPWLENYISLTLPRLSGMSVETQVNLLSALAVFGADLPRPWVAAFQLICVQQAEARTMTASQLEQVLVALGSRNITPSSALCQLYFDRSLPELPETSPSSIAAVLQALRQVGVQLDTHWLEAIVGVVRDDIRSYSLAELNVVAQSLGAVQAGGTKPRWLSDFVAYLKEFFLY